MIALAKYFSSAYDQLKRRILNVYQYGAKTAAECAPFGDDSCPVKGMDAIMLDTSTDDEPVVIGYLNLNQKALAGEKRLYSLQQNDSGKWVLAAEVWFKNDGTIQLNGNQDNAVRYAALNTALQNEVVKMNAELVKVQSAIAGLGGSYIRGQISVDISPAKIDNLKTS